jgi:phospholipase C
MATLADKTQHVIVLMLENRSFNHMLGYIPGVGDLSGRESNPSRLGQVTVSPDADYVLPIDPDHSHLGIMTQLANGNKGFVAAYDAVVERARKKKKHKNLPPDTAKAIMRCFAPDKVPVLGTLAREFVAFRRWFASVPGETWPNRNYAHAATSHGQVNISVRFYTDPTIFELLSRYKRSWRIYHDGPAQAWAFPNLWHPLRRQHFKGMDKLFAAIDHDELDHYSFIEPDHGLLPWDKTSNNQHPGNNTAAKRDGNDFVAAERLIAAVYDRLRANPPVFEKTLLLVTYDEHGGFFDREPPPAAVPPDRHVWKDGRRRFAFDSLGVRVPAVLISPWLDPAVITTGDYDHSSIVATLRGLFAPGAGPLTKRDGAAKTFHDLPARRTPRKDLPVVAPAPSPPDAHRRIALKARGPRPLEAPVELDDFQRSLVSLTEAVHRRLDAEATPSVRRSRVAPAMRLPAPTAVRKRFRSHEEMAVYMEYVTRRFHRSIDSSVLELTDTEGRVVERPDRATVERAFAGLAAADLPRGKVSLRAATDLIVAADRSGALRRLDLDTGVEQELTGVEEPTRTRDAEPASAPDLADRALAAIGRSDLR